MTFKYVAMSSSGKEVKGTVEAASSEEAVGKVRAMKYFPTKITETTENRKPIDIGIKLEEEADDTRLGEELLNTILSPKRPRLIDHEEVERRVTDALDERKNARKAKKVPWIILPKYGQGVLWFLFLFGLLLGILIGKII